jgi:hypothetical protein
MRKYLARTLLVLIILSISSIHGAHVEGDEDVVSKLVEKLRHLHEEPSIKDSVDRGVVGIVSTVTNAPKMLAERSRDIKVAHGEPVPAGRVPRFELKPDGRCAMAGPTHKQQIMIEGPLRNCDYLNAATGSADAHISGVPTA